MRKKETKTSDTVMSSGIGNSVNRTIHNWNEWFQLCGELQGDLQSYEKQMFQYYKLQYPNQPEKQQTMELEYQGRHKCGFYKESPRVPGWKLGRILLHAGIGVLVITILAILCTVIHVVSQNMSLPDYILAKGSADSNFVYLMKHGLLWGVLGGILLGLGEFGVHVFRVNRITKGLQRLEHKLRDVIAYIPPKYRNSQAVGTFYDLSCNYGVVTFNQAVIACDEYLMGNNLIGAYMAELFDVPYKNAGPSETEAPNDTNRGLYAGGDAGSEKSTSDPNLPDDIKTKTYKGVDNAEERLAELIGLENVKQQIQQMKNRMDFYNGAKSERISGNHMVFLGPPGTGKTTIARIITKILYDFGYIQENRCVEIDGGYMKSPYVGQTTERAAAIVRYAMGGVLFIDEAYLLLDDKNGSATGSEATGVLLKAMEDNKNDFVVIFAGYEDNVNRLLSSNEGFASRIKHKVYFDNFTVEEMVEIFHMQMRQYSMNENYEIMNDAMALLTKHFDAERGVPGFGNARVVRNALDSILDSHADHFMKGELPSEMKYKITKLDVESYVKVRRKQMQEDGRNFIASRNLDSSIISLQELKGKTKDGVKDPDKALAALTGLSVVKDEIAQMKAQFSFYDGKMESEGQHMVFLGPPGTGKTTVASIMTSYLYQMGLIRENRYLDINGDFLRGMYLGHTGKRTEAVVQYAQGMVLFIDEAYLLHSSDSRDSFGQEAVGVLLDAMEKYRKNFVVIFAGYEDEMDVFLDMNSGLRSRISLEFHFTSYTPHELAQMFQNVAKANKFTVEKDVWLPMQQYFKTQVVHPKFGNGRFIRQFFEACKKAHITNYANKQYGDDKKYVITLQDVEALLK